MGGIALLLVLCAVMTLTSFFAGILPLSISLSASQLRLVSNIGVGVLVGTALIIIIPEGIEAVAISVQAPTTAATTAITTAIHAHESRELPAIATWPGKGFLGIEKGLGGARWQADHDSAVGDVPQRLVDAGQRREFGDALDKSTVLTTVTTTRISDDATGSETDSQPHADADGEHAHMPMFDIGLSLVLGFAFMFLIDRLPRHATERFRAAPQPRHISLDSLGHTGNFSETENEGDGFLGSLAPSPRRARSLATTVGLVIHAVTDGIVVGASSAATATKLGLVVFAAIMIHKAPVSFGLTSVLVNQGLSKRAARGHLVVFSLAAPAGALGTWFVVRVLGGASLQGQAGQWWTGMLLLFSAGTFLYVAMHAMQDDSDSHGHGQGHHQNHYHHSGTSNGYGDLTPIAPPKRLGPQMRDTMATMCGMLLPLLAQLGHGHGH